MDFGLFKRLYCKSQMFIFFLLITLSVFAEAVAKESDFNVYVVRPISEKKILPKSRFIRRDESGSGISDEITIAATAGEYEPASFVIQAISGIRSFKPEATELKSEKGVIPAANIDIKIVKCWYQAGSAWYGFRQDETNRVLVPELLVNDDNLVKVDYKEQKNYLKLAFPDGNRYVWMSNPSEAEGDKRKILSVKDYPIKDSDVLLPVDIPAASNKQFWITVKIPKNAPEGIYSGNIKLRSEGQVISVLNLKVRVLPFKLAEPKTCYDLTKDFTNAIFYLGIIDPNYPNGSISSEYKSKEQFKAELANMYAHGITNPTCYQPFDKELLRQYLDVRKEVGLCNETLFYTKGSANADSSFIKKAVDFFRSLGVRDVYFYGHDEAAGEVLRSQRSAWQATRKAGGKIFVAGLRNENFQAVGDIQDLHICFGRPSKEEAGKWHSKGHKIFCYAYPQTVPEDPEIWRRNYGLLLWKANYDGASTFAYQCSLGNIWNDFDHPDYRDHVLAYPTINGVIDTIALEAYREGIDDIRYATTLKLEIEKAKKSKDKNLRRIASEAEKYLEEMNVYDSYVSISMSADDIRKKIINYILSLSQMPEIE